MVGSYSPVTFSSESTTDGINFDTSSVPDFGEDVYGNCVLTINETTIISFGGEFNERRVAVFTTGNSAWEVRLTDVSKI